MGWISQPDSSEGEQIDHANSGRTQSDNAVRIVFRRLILFSAPLGVIFAMWLHPTTPHGDSIYTDLTPVIDTWVATHLILFPSLGLLGIAVYLLLTGYQSPVATIGRVGLAVYGFLYLGFVAIVGLTSGLLIREGQTLPPEQQDGVAAVVAYLHSDPLLTAAAVVGAVGFLVATLAVAITYYREDAPLAPLILIVASSPALALHSGVGGMALSALFLVGAAWLEVRTPTTG